MGEVMITRRGTLGGDDEHFGQKRHFIRFVQNDSWVVPNDAINNEFNVICFGPGIHGICTFKEQRRYSSGYLNNTKAILTPGEKIKITIDATTSTFGNYLIGNRGSEHRGGSGGPYVDADQFGGGGGFGSYDSGNGGVWGGGGGPSRWASTNGGDGGLYGGGGCGIDSSGKGGKYGGNGSIFYTNGYIVTTQSYLRFLDGLNTNTYREYLKLLEGNSNYNFGENGTNTIGWTNVDKDINTGEYITGPGLAKTTCKRLMIVRRYRSSSEWGDIYLRTEAVGGGGFGGSSIGGQHYQYRALLTGYGLNNCFYRKLYINDNNNSGYIVMSSNQYEPIDATEFYPGGGGYGGNSYGGGGGYGKGADAFVHFSESCSGGAGYFTPSINGEAAGWGKFGTGGKGATNGICTVEYYTWE